MPRKLSTDEFIHKAKQIHGNKYDYSLTDYRTITKKIKIICPVHGVFEQVPKQHIKGRGCFKCGSIKSGKSQRKSVYQFIQESKQVHGDGYDYSLVDYTTNNTKINIICSIHGVFEQSPDKHLSGQGCPVCRYIKSASSKRKSTDQFIKESKNVHGDRYDYSLVDYISTHERVIIICSEHGIFEQIPLNHMRGQGCPQCKFDKQKSCTEEFITKARHIHGDRYDYSLVDYTGVNNKIKIICSEHGIFEQRPGNHINNKQNCPVCMSRVSYQEQELQEWLSQYIKIETNNRTLINPLELDIVIPSKKIAIEYNGIYWHSEQRGKDNTYHLLKYLKCKDKGYRLIQIWENEWLLKKDIVKSILLSAIGLYERKIGARQCGIRDINILIARQFYNNNHIQGFKGGIHKGLYYKDELISMMTINNSILERFASKVMYQVYGSFSRLLNSFTIYDKLITFSDLRYFTGDVYRKNGFEYLYDSKPNYWYFKLSDLKLYSRVQFQKHKLKDKLEHCNLNLTEYQNMLNNGYDRIWDCGNMKFIKRYNQ